MCDPILNITRAHDQHATALGHHAEDPKKSLVSMTQMYGWESKKELPGAITLKVDLIAIFTMLGEKSEGRKRSSLNCFNINSWHIRQTDHDADSGIVPKR
jgi:hypothetical protein